MHLVVVLMVVLTLQNLKKEKRQKKETIGGGGGGGGCRAKKDRRFRRARKAPNKWANNDFIVGGGLFGLLPTSFWGILGILYIGLVIGTLTL